MRQIKIKLLNGCKEYVEKRSKTIIEIISSNKNALLSETKSSAGDKHETSRAMIQLEIEKASMQLPSIRQMKETLEKIKLKSKHESVRLGSLIQTDHRNYFIAISVGNLTVDGINYIVISPSSPIGSILMGKIKGDNVSFNDQKFKILAIH